MRFAMTWCVLSLFLYSQNGLAADSGGAEKSIAMTLVSVRGSVTVSKTRKDAPVAARAGMTLDGGSILHTGDDSYAEVSIDGASRVRVFPRSELALPNTVRKASIKRSLMLYVGRVWNEIRKTGEVNYELVTANAVCGVRGTVFETGVSVDGAVLTRVSEGTVNVAGDNGSVDVGAMQQVSADENGVGSLQASRSDPDWNAITSPKASRLTKEAKSIVAKTMNGIAAERTELESLSNRQKDLAKTRDSLISSGLAPDHAKVAALGSQIAHLGDQIADTAERLNSKFGLLDAIKEVANDSRFPMADRDVVHGQIQQAQQIRAAVEGIANAAAAIPTRVINAPSQLQNNTGANGADRAASLSEMVTRGQQVLAQITLQINGMRAQSAQAAAGQDTIRHSCIEEAITAAMGVESAARAAMDQLEGASSKGDDSLGESALNRVMAAAPKVDRLVTQANQCRSSARVGESRSNTELEIADANRTNDSANNTPGGTPQVTSSSDSGVASDDSGTGVIVRPPVASPYQ